MRNAASESAKMSDQPHTEERYPLLFLFLDDGQKSSRKGRGVFFDRTRSHGIMSGATTVLTQWPNQLSSCGLSMLLLLVTTILLSLILIACTIKPVPIPIRPRCLKRNFDGLSKTNLYLVHDADDWQQNQLESLEEIATKYNQCDIELTIFRSSAEPRTNSTNLPKTLRTQLATLRQRPPFGSLALPRKKRQLVKGADDFENLLKDKVSDDIDLNINIGAKKLLKAFLERRRHLNLRKSSTPVPTTSTTEPPVLTINDLIAKFPMLTVRNTTKKSFFEHSPLHERWKDLNSNALLFAARVLKLWQNGGISFELPKTVTSSGKRNVSSSTTSEAMARTLSPADENKIIKNMIAIGYGSFKNLPEGLVTVDEEGVHMETKTTCHAFFGEALEQLQAATNATTVPEVIRRTLKTFCERGAVDSDYCNSIKT